MHTSLPEAIRVLHTASDTLDWGPNNVHQRDTFYLDEEWLHSTIASIESEQNTHFTRSMVIDSSEDISYSDKTCACVEEYPLPMGREAPAGTRWAMTQVSSLS